MKLGGCFCLLHTSHRFSEFLFSALYRKSRLLINGTNLSQWRLSLTTWKSAFYTNISSIFWHKSTNAILSYLLIVYRIYYNSFSFARYTSDLKDDPGQHDTDISKIKLPRLAKKWPGIARIRVALLLCEITTTHKQVNLTVWKQFEMASISYIVFCML